MISLLDLRPRVFPAILFCAAVLMSTPFSRAGGENSSNSGEVYKVYNYRMKGKVRLLFFWVGKDDVGGGFIALGRKSEPGGKVWRQEVEVLFGSNPERVPGKINRWGYGREESEWMVPVAAPSPRLVETTFEGFMKHSKEESLSEVQANNGAEKTSGSFVYDGIQSSVGSREAVSEIRTFSTTEDFDYRNAAPIHCGYQKRLQSGPPDKSRRMPNQEEAYAAPFGFLTGVNSVIQRTVRSYAEGENWMSLRPSLVYIYNAQKYRLELKKLKLEKDFDLPLPPVEGKPDQNRTFQQVAKAEFKISKLGTDWDDEFNIWFPLTGEFQGVPLRIEDKPRWWLRIELNLDPTRDPVKVGAERLAAKLQSCP